MIIFITGLGGGMATMGCYTIVPEFFTKRRSLALAVLNTGAGLGSAVTPSLITFLIEKYGTRGALLLSGGISLQTLPLALLFQTYKATEEVKDKRTSKTSSNTEDMQSGGTTGSTTEDIEMTIYADGAPKSPESLGNGPQHQNTSTVPELEVNSSISYTSSYGTIFLIAGTMSCFHMSLSTMGIFLPSLATEKGFQSDISLIMTVMGIVEIASMIPWGLLLDAPFACKNRPYIYCGLLVSFSACSGLLAIIPDVTWFGFLVGLSAFTKESVYCQLSAILLDIFGQERMTNVYGKVTLFMGLALLTWPFALGRYCSFFNSGIFQKREGDIVRHFLCPN